MYSREAGLSSIKQMNRRLAVIIIILGLSYLLYSERATFRGWLDVFERAPEESSLPTPSPYDSQSPSSSANPTSTPLKPAVNLDIPFTSQAPFKVWDEDHEEFCEEAAVLMVVGYVRGDSSITDPAVADARLYEIKNWELATFGYFEDTTAAETVRIIREHFGISKVELFNNPSINDMKSWLDQGRAIIVPAAGQQLGNPNFTAPGPLYHMVVVKGYTSDGKFITNDAGTRKGADYIYDQSVIMNAMHDWNGGDVTHGAKVVIVVG